MIYKILDDEKGLRIEGYKEDNSLGFSQPFNSFTGENFTSIKECHAYCINLGYQLTIESTSDNTTDGKKEVDNEQVQE